MQAKALGEAEKRGAVLSILVVLLILVLFLSVLLIGQPISYLGSEQLSIAYVLGVYTPVMLMCVVAYWRIKRS